MTTQIVWEEWTIKFLDDIFELGLISLQAKDLHFYNKKRVVSNMGIERAYLPQGKKRTCFPVGLQKRTETKYGEKQS